MSMTLPDEQGPRAGFADRPVKAVTFQGKMDLPIHRWYRLTPSVSPVLATDYRPPLRARAGRPGARPVQRAWGPRPSA